MKQTWVRFTALVLAGAFLIPGSLMAQNEKEKDKEPKKKEDVRQIIITSKTDKDQKIVVEVKGEKIIVNGKPIEEFTGDNDDISVRVSKVKDMGSLYRISTANGWHQGEKTMFQVDDNRAMLGVTTEKTGEGVKVNTVSKESAAEKIGIKEGDIITKVNETKIDDPDDLSSVIRKQKPGEKVNVTYLRDKKEQTGTAELTKWKTNMVTMNGNLNMDLADIDLKKVMPRVQGLPYTPNGQSWDWSGGSPKLGISVQDSDDGKGVKVLEVDDESNAAKAGVKVNDILMEVDGKAVNSTDDVVKVIRESKQKVSVMMKLQRDGKIQNIEVKMPRRIKTADL